MARPEVTQHALTRRRFLFATSAISIPCMVQWPTGTWAASFDVDAFIALSKKQLGSASLSEDVAAKMLSAYTTMGKEDALADLANGKEDPDLANSVVAAWYTGESPDPDDLQVLDYTDALIWDAMDYTKPMAYCGGETGYWADPPEE